MSLTIVVGFDDSPPSHAALDTAVMLAEETGGRVILTGGNPHGALLDPPRVAGGEVHALTEATETAAARAREQGADVEVRVLVEDPVRALILTAEDRDADLIVVGSRGEGALAGAVLGSTTYKLLHHSKHPVLVVPAP